MQGHNITWRRFAAIGAAIALGLVISPAAPVGATGRGDAATGTLPGDTAVPFWPHETGALVGTSETFLNVETDGSYYDPSLGRRVAGAVESNATRPDDRAGVRGRGAYELSRASSAATRPDDRAGVRGPTAFQTVAVRADPTGFDWGDAFLGGLGGMATALMLTGLLFLVVGRRSKIARIA